jgi:hypothetical protein
VDRNAGIVATGTLKEIAAMPRFDCNVSKYWLWLVVIAGLSMAAPCASQLSVLYLDALQSFEICNPKKDLVVSHPNLVIIAHALISVVLAVIFTIISQVAAKASKKPIPGEARRFKMSTLFVATTVIGCIFGGFKYLGSEPVLYFVVLLFAAGRVVSLYLTAFFFARAVPKSQDNNKL